MTKGALSLILLGMGLAMGQPAKAVNGSSIELGSGDDSTNMARVTLRWNWDKRWSIGQSWHATGFWEAGLGYWDGDGAGAKNLWDIGITPVFRLGPVGSRFFLEAAIGAHYLSDTRINDDRDFGGNFSFGSHMGFGWLLGAKDRYELGYRFQHLSNAGISEPNDGINFHQIRLGYNY
jgi:lipid A 3-O-deacylase